MKKCSFWFVAIAILFSAAPVLAERMAVNVSIANVRSGPGTQYDVLWKIERYHPIQVLKKKGGWIYFQDFEGDKGWIFKKLLSNNNAVIVKNNKVNVRSGPGTNYDILFTVERGVPFRVLQQKGVWLQVVHSDGDKGWIHKSLTW